MNCPYCKQELVPGSKFCPNCGAQLMQNPNAGSGTFPQTDNGQGRTEGYDQQMGVPRSQGGQPGQPYYQSQPQGGQPGQSYNSRTKGTKKRKKKKGGFLRVVSIAIFGIIALGILGSLFSDSDESTQEEKQAVSEEKTVTEAEDVVENQTETEDIVDDQSEAENMAESQGQEELNEEDAETIVEEMKNPEELDLSSARTELENGGYAFITLEDMSRYIVNMTGQRIYTVVTADNVNSDRIQANIDGGFMYQSFITSTDYSEYFREGDTLAVFGTVGETQDLLGADWTDVVDSQVFAYGEEAEAYKKDVTDESLSGFLVLTEEVANSQGKNNISEDEFKSLCEYYSYEDILRNPDSYEKKYAVLSGTVDQTVEGVFGLYTTLYITDGNGDKWDCSITYNEGQSHILEGDYVTVYGILNGTSTSTTVLGQQVTMPSLQVEYVE